MANQYAQNAEYGGLVSGMANNHPEVNNNEGYNTFDRSSIFLQTQRFADVNPIYAHKFVTGDIAPIESAHDLRTYTLASPLLTNVYMHRSFYSVPLQAIYPNTFEAFFKPQIKGQDFPSAAKPILPLSKLLAGSNSVRAWLSSNVGTESGNSEELWMQMLFLLLNIFSKDGLLYKLGYGFKNVDVDYFVDDILSQGAGLNFQVLRPSDSYAFSFDPGDTSVPLSIRRFYLLKIIQNKYELQGIQYSGSTWTNFRNTILNEDFFSNTYSLGSGDGINLEKVLAYQLVCAQFFSNSYVDDINTAKKWIDNQLILMQGPASYSGQIGFTLNGKRYLYDIISNQMLNLVLSTAITSTSLSDKKVAIACMRNIFEIHESLKTSDYFVDSRTQPLAVGDVYASVVSSQVSAIDVNHALWMQRLLNAVNRIPDNIVEYVRKMFGSDPISKEPQPMFISSERFLIGGQEVENTSDTNQGNTVTLLRSKEPTRYRFEVRVSEPSVIIGVNSYSMDIVYASAIDKEFTEFDRYDNFNPYLQHIGDQPVTQQEICNDLVSSTHLNNFAYQLRYAQPKTLKHLH